MQQLCAYELKHITVFNYCYAFWPSPQCILEGWDNNSTVEKSLFARELTWVRVVLTHIPKKGQLFLLSNHADMPSYKSWTLSYTVGHKSLLPQSEIWSPVTLAVTSVGELLTASRFFFFSHFVWNTGISYETTQFLQEFGKHFQCSKHTLNKTGCFWQNSTLRCMFNVTTAR